jgi:hypothetical protein
MMEYNKLCGMNKKGIVWIAFFILIMSTVIYYILRNVAA